MSSVISTRLGAETSRVAELLEGRQSGSFESMRILGAHALLLPILLLFAPIARAQSRIVVEGVVRDMTGGFIPGATVRLYSAERVRETKTGHDGEFAFQNLSAGIYDLESTSPGFRTQTIENIAITDKAMEPFPFRLQPGVGDSCAEIDGESYYGVFVSYRERLSDVDVAGTVRDRRGSPLGLAASRLTMAGESRSVQSDENGAFDFAHMPSGKYVLNVSHAGYWSASRTLWLTHVNVAEVTVVLPDKNEVVCIHER